MLTLRISRQGPVEGAPKRRDRATVTLQDICCETIHGCSCREAVRLLNVRYVSITTKFRTAADAGIEGMNLVRRERRISRGLEFADELCGRPRLDLYGLGIKRTAFGQVVRRDLRVT